MARFAFVILIFLTLFSSCTPKKEADPRAEETLQTGAQGGILLNKSSDQSDPPEKTEEPVAEEVPVFYDFTGPVKLQSLKSDTYYLSNSTIAGKQTDPLSLLLDERDAYSLVQEFWNKFSRGLLPMELLSADVHPVLEEELKAFLVLKPEIRTVYPGHFQWSGKRSQMRIALLSESHYIHGEMFLINDGRGWKVEDWDLPYASWPGKKIPRFEDLSSLPGVY